MSWRQPPMRNRRKIHDIIDIRNDKLLSRIKKQLTDSVDTDDMIELVCSIHDSTKELEHILCYFNDCDDLNRVSDNDPHTLLSKAHYGKWNPTDDYFHLDDYGNI